MTISRRWTVNTPANYSVHAIHARAVPDLPVTLAVARVRPDQAFIALMSHYDFIQVSHRLAAKRPVNIGTAISQEPRIMQVAISFGPRGPVTTIDGTISDITGSSSTTGQRVAVALPSDIMGAAPPALPRGLPAAVDFAYG